MVIIKKPIPVEIEYVTIKNYLNEMYEGFCKQYGMSPKAPNVGFAMHSMIRDRALEDLLSFCRLQGTGSVRAREKDKKGGLNEKGALQTYIGDFTLKQNIVLCSTKEFWSGYGTQKPIANSVDRQLKKLTQTTNVPAYMLRKDPITGINHLSLINDPDALNECPIDTLPDTNVPPTRKETESAVEYASRLAEEADIARSMRLEHLADNMTDGPQDDQDDSDISSDRGFHEIDKKAGLNRGRLIADYFGFPED